MLPVSSPTTLALLAARRRGEPAQRLGGQRPDVRRSFGSHLVLDGLSLEAAEGPVAALLSPNGAGRTTSVRVPSALVPPTPARSGWLTTTWSPTPTGPAP